MRNNLFSKEMEGLALATGYKNLKSMYFLHNLVRFINPASVLELGTGYGASAIYMAAGIGHERTIVTIDDYKFMKYEGKPIDWVRRHLDACGDFSNKIILVEGSTFDAANLAAPYSISPEVVFMDASHDLVGMQKEYRGLKSLLPNEHVIILDDLFSPVAKFMDEMSKAYAFCLTIKDFHQGMAVLCTNRKYLVKIGAAIEGVE